MTMKVAVAGASGRMGRMLVEAIAAAPDATLRFTVRHCTGTSAADFDPGACEPAPMTTQLIDILPPDDPTDAGRPPMVAIEDDTLVLTNLEERTYTLSPAMSLVGNGPRSWL